MGVLDTGLQAAQTVCVDTQQEPREQRERRERAERLRRAVESVAETRKIVAERLARSDARRAG
ncbi:MAG: hypothetical protein JWN17_2146 [Frankiales bacterium]|nr:hypothetical protein [Frankiales bacterium]